MDWSKFKSFWKKEDNLSEAQRNRKLIISLAFKAIVLLMLVILLIYAAISLVLGSSLFLPNSASAVLESAAKEQAPEYYWVSESKRTVTFNKSDVSEEQLAFRAASISETKNRFYGEVYNVLSDSYNVWSNGWKESPRLRRYTAAVSGSRAESLSEINTKIAGIALTDPCSGEEPVSSKAVSLPDPSLFQEANPKILTDKGTFQGKRSWVLSFKPNEEIIERMLWLPFFRQAFPKGDWQTSWKFILSNKEEEAISKGLFRASKGWLWVTRDSRQLSQIIVDFSTKNPDFASKWRLLGQVQEPERELIIDDMKLAAIDCQVGLK